MQFYPLGKKIMRDIAYEQAVLKHQRKILRILNEYSLENTDDWTERDLLAIQRALQIFIESFIGMARYLVQQKYTLSVSQSREAIDELKTRGDLTANQYQQLLAIIGFRNILVHDYLDINEAIVEAIIIKKHYAIMEELLMLWKNELNFLA